MLQNLLNRLMPFIEVVENRILDIEAALSPVVVGIISPKNVKNLIDITSVHLPLQKYGVSID